MEYHNITWIPLSHGSRDHVCQFSWDLEKICRKISKKCVLKKIQNGWKSILMQMGVAYLGRCVTIQGIQGNNNFDFPTHGSRVIDQKVTWAVIAPPLGPSWIFRWLTGFSDKVGPRHCACQFWCLHHKVNDSIKKLTFISRTKSTGVFHGGPVCGPGTQQLRVRIVTAVHGTVAWET